MKTALQTGYKDYPWRLSYRTSSLVSQGKPVDILHDFYIPVLKRSVRYDRVAGYFRSTSLAAASQGFSAFFSNKGSARFIVGADLDKKDIAAILEASRDLKSGHSPPELERALNSELDPFEDWPEHIQNGVQLLSFLIRKGILEIRVAFRVHARTGYPLGTDSVVDGYVHEKWGIFTDVHGNRIYISGSLNESRAALTVNAENIDVHCDWKGESDRLRADEAEKEFELIWNNLNPAFQVLTLPEAVHRRFIKISETVTRPREIDGSSAAPAETSRPSPEEFLRFSLIKDGPRLPGGRFAGMETAPVSPWPHQEIVARRLIGSWPFSYLLCDEVGLGKTIEAGLVIRSLYLSGLVRRALIACPASLTEQWHREMAGKFLLPFGRSLCGTAARHEYLLPAESQQASESLYSPDLNIISTGLLVRPERRKEFERAEDFDLILVDEAHYARQMNSVQGFRSEPRFNRLYKTIAGYLRLKTKSLVLATATPMQIHPAEIFDLIRFTRRTGAFQDNPGLISAYYEILECIASGKSLSPEEWAFLRKAVLDVEKHDPLYFQYLRQTVINGRIRTSVRRWLEQNRIPRPRDLKAIRRLIFSASPISRVMLRHTRPLLEIYREKKQLNANLAERIVLPPPRIIFTRQEQTCYDQLAEYCRKLSAEILSNGDKTQQTSLGFYLSFLRLRFASSLFAIRKTLKRRRDKIQNTLAFLLSKECFTVKERRSAFFAQQASLLEAAGFSDNKGEETEPEHSEMDDLLDAGDDDAEIIQNFLQYRNKADLQWEYNYLNAMLETLSDLSGTSSKMSALLGILDKRRIPGTGRLRQTVIFTRFYDTLTDIVERLRRIDPHMRIGIFSGQRSCQVPIAGCGLAVAGCPSSEASKHLTTNNKQPATTNSLQQTTHNKQLTTNNRQEVKRLFLNKEIDILVCTDAAAEGLNLQTADMLVNFDLPWNPMKVEQRIGRIDRIGQIHERIYVHNLCYAGSAEEIVYGRLLSRLTRAGNIVGTQQISLLPVTREDFKSLAEGTLSQAELEEKAGKAAKLAKERAAGREIPPEDLYHIYLRLKARSSSASAADSLVPEPLRSPVTLESIWKTLSNSAYLEDIGCTCLFDNDSKTLILRNIPGICNGTLLTASRRTFEYGLKGISNPIHFASYGDPVFDALLDHVSGSDAPECIRRLETRSPGHHGSLTGYAAACFDSAGNKTTRLITAYDELEDLKLNPSAQLTDAETDPLQNMLNTLAACEFRQIKISSLIESLNDKAAVSQTVLNYMIIRSLLELRQKFGIGEIHFWAEIKSIEDQYKDEDFQEIANLEKEKVQKLRGHLFDIHIPASGNNCIINAPVFLILSALDSVSQLAHRMRKKKSEVLTADVLGRLDREINRLLMGLNYSF